MITTINIHDVAAIRGERQRAVVKAWLLLRFGATTVTAFLPDDLDDQLHLLAALRDDVAAAVEQTQKEIVERNHAAIVDANHAELTVVRHDVPDPPTQEGCTSCGNDLRHGFVPGDRVVMVAPMTARQHGRITGFALDKADVVVDGRNYPTTIHTKWLALEELVDAPPVEAEAEGIRRDLARENEFFTRTQGWDPSRPDGP